MRSDGRRANGGACRSAAGSARSAHRAARAPLRRALALSALLCQCAFGQANLGVIIHPPELADAAAAWREHREATGWDIELIEAAPDAAPEALRERVRNLVGERDTDRRVALLLLGDVREDRVARVPTFRFDQLDPSLLGHQRGETKPTFASDHPYALLGDDETRTIAVGRVPVSTDADARAVLAKVRRYEESAPSGWWRQRLTYVAGEARFGLFDPVFERLFVAFVDDCVPPAFDVSMTYAKCTSPWCPDPERIGPTTLERLAEGSLLFTYAGHGFATGLDSLRWTDAEGAPRASRILTTESLGALPPTDGRHPIALLSCCSTGWFDLADGRDCLGEALLKHPDGPVVVVAGTRVTHPYGNALIVKEFTRELLARPDLPCGEVDRRARLEMLATDRLDRKLDAIVAPIARAMRWRSSLEELRLMHVRMYAYLGDPMVRIASPGIPIAELRLIGGALIGEVASMSTGRVAVTIESARDASAAPEAPVPAAPGDDVQARTRRNYPLMRERALWHGTGVVWGEAFEIPLPEPLPPGCAFVRVRASGIDAEGTPIDAFGGLRVAKEPRGAQPVRE